MRVVFNTQMNNGSTLVIVETPIVWEFREVKSNGISVTWDTSPIAMLSRDQAIFYGKKTCNSWGGLDYAW